MILISILAFALIFTLLVLVHEAGHFWAARIFGIGVKEFAVGLPPNIASIEYNGTKFSLNLIPLGGYVRLKGEEEDIEAPDSINAQPPWIQMIVSMAGIVMNIVLAFVVVLFGFYLGMPPVGGAVSDYTSADNVEATVLIADTQAESPASEAGFEAGDEVLEVNGESVQGVERIQQLIEENGTQTAMTFLVRRGESTTEIEVTPKEERAGPQIGFLLRSQIEGVEYDPLKAPYYAVVETGKITERVAVAFWDLLAGLVEGDGLPQDVAGPVGIAQLSGQVVMLGIFQTLQFIILLSVNLAILNAIPFPALDGGRFVLSGVEIIRRKPVSPEIKNWIHVFGFILLIIFIIFVTYKDIIRIITG